MGRRRVWLLNLDAEDELARPVGYTPSRSMLARIEALAPRLRAKDGCPGLVGEDDWIVAEWQSGGTGLLGSGGGTGLLGSGGGTGLLGSGDARAGVRATEGDGKEREEGPAWGDVLGMAWCPTPRARRALAKVGVALGEAPSLSVLQEVNHRRFSAQLGQTLPGARLAASEDEVREALNTGRSPTGKWLLKRAFGFAGRGRLEIEPGRTGEIERARTWILASLRAGGALQVEPLVERIGDYALHGYLPRGDDREGGSLPGLVLGEPTRQECDATGAWVRTALAEPGDLTPSDREALFDEARRTARALREAGYWGPFGVDAFRWNDERSRSSFNPRCEVNARYSMGWATGMSSRRPDLDE